MTHRQELREDHRLDANGNPAGGFTQGVGIDIKWQDGPLGRGDDRVAPNGAFVEDVIQAVIGRLEFYQDAADGKFANGQNEEAIEKLLEALDVLDSRTAEREQREVEGTHEP